MKRILLVEDNLGDARLAQELLAEISDFEVHVTCAGRVSDAEDMLLNQPIDLVLLDLSLPDSEGLEGLRRLQSLSQNAMLRKSGWLLKFVWLNEINQLNKTNQMNQINQFRLLREPELKFRSPLQLQTLSSSPREFQDIERILVWPILGAAVVRSRADRDTLLHMDDLFFLIHPDEIEWDLGVLHPEYPGLRLRERKEHAAVGA